MDVLLFIDLFSLMVLLLFLKSYSFTLQCLPVGNTTISAIDIDSSARQENYLSQEAQLRQDLDFMRGKRGVVLKN